MSLTPHELAVRREGISGTDVAAIVGLHPQRTRLDVFLEKTGRAEPFVETTRSRWGTILEVPIREDYEQRHNVRVEVPTTMRHPAKPWMVGSPDGIVYPAGSATAERGIEIKTHGRDAVWFGGLEYGDPGTDQVPPHELAQCAWYMGITGLPRFDLVAFLDGAPVEYTIERDDELIEMLADEAERFLVDHVRAGVEPPPDGSKPWRAWLGRKWKTNSDELVDVDGDEPTIELIAELRRARVDAAELKAAIARVGQRLRNVIGDKAGLTFREPGRAKPSKMTWKFSKDRTVVDHEAVVADMRATAALVLSARGSALNDIAAAGNGFQPIGKTDAAAIADAVDALTAIASGDAIAARTATVPGNRVFLTPRHWRKDDKIETDKPETTNGDSTDD